MSELSDTEARAVAIATDQLQSLVDTLGDDDPETPKNKWAIVKLDKMLVENGHPEWVAIP
jgi:hypothetical protein